MAILQYGSIVYAPIVSSDGSRKEPHPFVVLTPTDEIPDAAELEGVGISTKPDFCLTSQLVKMPIGNPGTKCRTGLTKRCAAHCNRLVLVKKAEIKGLIGHTPAKQLSAIEKLVDELKKAQAAASVG